MELWINLAHIGYPNYSISDTGRIRNDKRGNTFMGSKSSTKYRQATLRDSSGTAKTEYID